MAKAAMMLIAMISLLTLTSWGRSVSDIRFSMVQGSTTEWSDNQVLFYRAWAGPLPGIAADMAVLDIFNIYANSQQAPLSSKELWWSQLHNQLMIGQAMDPYFRDIYRLTEGLLAYEANKMQESVDLLAKSEPFLNSSDPLLVAAFIAHQELHNDELAFDLANRASKKTDAQQIAVGFASSILRKSNGCRIAIEFLAGRLQDMPEKYQQGIKNRIQSLQTSDSCRNEFMGHNN